MRDNTVSVVIPTHERPRLLAQTLRSVLAQTGVDMEVIIVDDGSAAGSVERALPRNDRLIRVVRHDRPRGVSEARNAGVRASSGAWVAFLDDDDLWAPWKLQAQLDALAASPDHAWSYVGLVTVRDCLQVIGWAAPPEDPDVFRHMLVDDVLPGGSSGVVASRELLVEAGPFDPALSCCADWDMFLRLSQHSSLASVHRPLLAYRIHAMAMTATVGRCSQEFEVIDRRYAGLRDAHGVAIDRATWEEWKAAMYLRAGNRTLALRTAYGCARADRNWRRFVRSTAITLLPGGVRIRDRRERNRIPAAWRAEAESWLAPFQVT